MTKWLLSNFWYFCNSKLQQKVPHCAMVCFLVDMNSTGWVIVMLPINNKVLFECEPHVHGNTNYCLSETYISCRKWRDKLQKTMYKICLFMLKQLFKCIHITNNENWVRSCWVQSEKIQKLGDKIQKSK